MHTFYADSTLRQRLVEFLGGDTLPHATAVHVTHTDGCLLDRRELRPATMPPARMRGMRQHGGREGDGPVNHKLEGILPGRLLENMLQHLLFGHVSDMMYLLGRIHTGSVGTCFDTGHAHLAGEMGIVIQKLSGHLKMVYFNDNHGDRDAHLFPGDGGIDWPRVVVELGRNGFHGMLVLELSAWENESIENVLARAVRAREFMERLG